MALTLLIMMTALIGSMPRAHAGDKPVRNIIVMISDGAGYNTFDACSYYQYGALGEQVYDSFPKKYALTHYMLNSDGQPQGYDPDVDTFIDWMPVVNNGAGNLPGVQYASGGHTNTPVPLFAKGSGANMFNRFVDGRDRGAKNFWGTPGGKYVDNTDIFWVLMRHVVEPEDHIDERSLSPHP